MATDSHVLIDALPYSDEGYADERVREAAARLIEEEVSHVWLRRAWILPIYFICFVRNLTFGGRWTRRNWYCFALPITWHYTLVPGETLPQHEELSRTRTGEPARALGDSCNEGNVRAAGRQTALRDVVHEAVRAPPATSRFILVLQQALARYLPTVPSHLKL